MMALLSLSVIAIILFGSMALALFRIWSGPTIADRAIAIDVIVTASVGLLGIATVMFDASYMIDVMLIVAAAFVVGGIGLALYMEKTGEH
jgi:multicomponent Na+:H+ antiporter subunit F